MNRRLMIILALVAVLAVAALMTRGFGLIGRADSGPLTLYGNVDIREVDLGFRVGGRIAGIGVDEGDRVRAGQLLATMETTSIDSRVSEADARIAEAQAQLAKLQSGNRRQEIAQARARVTAAQAAADNAQRDYARRQPLVEPGAISRDLWEQTIADKRRADAQLAEARQGLSLLSEGARREDIQAAQAQLGVARAARSSVATDLSDTRIHAPLGGTIVTRAREPGAIVQPSETVLTLSIDRPMRVRAYVAETDLSRIGPGMKVEVTADGNPRTYHGTIGYIAPKAEFTPKSVETESLRTDLVYRLRVIVSDPDDALRQGQPVTVRVPGARPAHRD